MKSYRISERNLRLLASYSMQGEYNFPRHVQLWEVQTPRLRGRHVFADHGFRWSGQTGGYREHYTLLPPLSATKLEAIEAAIKAGDPCEAQVLAYEINPLGQATVKVI